MKQWVYLLLLGGFAYLALMLYLYLNQSNMIHLPNLPNRLVQATPQSIGLTFEQVTLNTDDQIKLEGWYLPVDEPRATLLFFHGNAGNISHRLDSLQIFHELGLSVFIFDYRGYGNSQGRPTEAGIYRDAETAWRYLVETRRIPAQDILLFGRSLGGAVAAYLAEQYPAMGLVLESTFTSIPDMAAAHYPWLPTRLLARVHYNTRERLVNIHIPVMVIHSQEDEIIPYNQGRQLYSLAHEPKRFLELRGDHNHGLMQDQQHYRQGLDDFVRLSIRHRDSKHLPMNTH